MRDGLARYPHLFSSLQIRNVTVRNRILQTGHGKLVAREGVTSRRNVDYQVERAKGGIGLIITGIRIVHPSAPLPRVSLGYLPERITADRRLVEGVHEHGAVIFSQLGHTGLMFSSDLADDLRVLWGPSAVRSPFSGEIPKEMEPEDIREAVEWWARSAEIAREAGYDGVELHFAHNYLIHEFLSPSFNKRTDEYGGRFENRFRFAREVIEAVRRSVGSDFVVGARIGVSDFADGAFDIEDAIQVAIALETSDLIDYVSASVGGGPKAMEISPSDLPDGHLVDLTARIKDALTTIPVFVVGGIKDPAQAEEILASDRADMVGMTRAQIADPEFANKVSEGREAEILHCIRCNQGCIGRGFKGLPVACAINPATGREQRFGAGTLMPADLPARWLVVGGGPAGMKAAETLAKRGHAVTLLEQGDQLGGQINLILRTPGRETFAWLTRDLATHMAQNGVDVRLGTEATPQLVHELAPDRVVVATGAVPSRTGFTSALPLVETLPGVDRDHVLTVWDVLLGSEPVGKRVVVLDDDGTRYAAGTAEVLLDRGNEVELITPLNMLFPSTAFTTDMSVLYSRLFRKGLRHQLNSWVTKIDERSLVVSNLYSGEATRLEDVDVAVLATAPKANADLYFQLKDSVSDLHRVGDCVAPRRLDHAIYEGYLAGRELWSVEDRCIVEGSLERWEDRDGESEMQPLP